MTYQTTNDFDLTRQDGTYTGATGELVVSDGGTITLPTPTAGEKFGVRALRNDVTLLSNGSIEASTSDRRIDSEGNSVFVSDGTEWYLVSGNEYFGFDIPDSGIARWTFDNTDTQGNTAVDVWGDNDGTISGATTGASGANQTYTTNESYSFDGIDDEIQTTSNPSVASDTTTWAFWLNTTTGSDDNIFFKNSEYDIRINGSSGAGGFQLATFGDNSGTMGSGYNDGNWHHIVLQYDQGTEYVLYVDGSFITSVGTNDTESSSSNDLYIASTNGGRFYSGRLDDIRIYYKKITSTEVSNLYTTGSI